MRAVLLVIDSFGIGALPDAETYGDSGSNTALHICQTVSEIRWPHLQRLGLGNAAQLLGWELPGVPAARSPAAHFAVMREKSAGKDTTTGHWELAGLVLDQPFHYFSQEPPSFPAELLNPFRKEFACDILGNTGASGTEIIARLGEEHLETGNPIFYTSADSVLQIAAHEAVRPVEELYSMCQYMRNFFDQNGLPVGRVIARPYAGEVGNFQRTSRRKDFSMPLPEPSVLDRLQEQGITTIGVGKIGDIFGGRGLSQSYPDKGNAACLERTLQLLEETQGTSAFLFVNLVDTDMIYGHRRDPQGYHDAVAAIDARLPEIQSRLDPGDVLLISADHGCDPTFPGTDHTREHVPLLAYVKESGTGKSWGIREQFTDVAATLCAFFEAGTWSSGSAFPLDQSSGISKD